jgi:hypothetical protein
LGLRFVCYLALEHERRELVELDVAVVLRVDVRPHLRDLFLAQHLAARHTHHRRAAVERRDVGWWWWFAAAAAAAAAFRITRSSSVGRRRRFAGERAAGFC